MLTVRIITLIILVSAVLGCRKTEESNQVLKEAMDLYVYANSSVSNIDSSIILTNKALELDSRNIAALNYKVSLMFATRNESELLKTSEEIVQLLPRNPYYLGQHAFYNELAENVAISQKFYARSIQKYQKKLKKSPKDFELCLEYITILRLSNDTMLVSQTLQELQDLEWDKSQEKILHYYKNETDSKQKIVDFWNEKITYEELEGTLESLF